MSRLGRIYRTSIGAKSVMALTGLALFLFLIGHLSGNLLVFGGQDAINTYAHWLHSNPKLIWGARIGLLVLFVAARLHRLGALAGEPRRAAGALPQGRHGAGDGLLAHDDLDRARRARLRRLPPAALHAAGRRLGVDARPRRAGSSRRLHDGRARLFGSRRHDRLPRRAGAARLPPVARASRAVPDARLAPPDDRPRCCAAACRCSPADRGRQLPHPPRRSSPEPSECPHEARRTRPRRSARREVGPLPPGHEARQPGQQAQVQRDRRRLRPGGRRGGGDARRARLQGRLLLLPGQPAPRALDRRAGRHQRREELPERRRQRLPAVLRHRQGRRLPLARGERLPARARSASTSSTSASRRACRSRASTAACSTTARSAARRSRARSTRAARPASSCCSARYPALERQIGAGHGEDVSRAPRCSTWSSSTATRAGIVMRDLVTGRDRVARRPTPWCSRPAATATSSTSRPTRRAATSPRPGARTSAARCFANPCFTQIHPTCIPVSGDYQSQAHADVASRCATTAASGCRRSRATTRSARRDPRGRARLLPRAQVPELRQPRAARHRLARRQGGLRRGPRRRRRAGAASTSTSATRSSALGEDAIARALRQPVRHVRADHRREPVRGADADLPGRRTTRWAACGSTTT